MQFSAENSALACSTGQCSAPYRELHSAVLPSSWALETLSSPRPSLSSNQLYTALHCTALHCPLLHCTVLHCTALQYTALTTNTIQCTTQRYSSLTTLNRIAQFIALYLTVLHPITLHCTVEPRPVQWFATFSSNNIVFNWVPLPFTSLSSVFYTEFLLHHFFKVN